MASEGDPALARERYLRAALRRFGVALLPAPDERMTLALEPIYQPLRLRQTPLVAGAERQVSEREEVEARERGADDVAQRETPGDVRGKTQVAAHGEAALAQSPEGRIVILGGPGAGKTTTLHRLAMVAARGALSSGETGDAAPLPLYLTLPGLAASGLALADAAAEAALALLDEAGEDGSQEERDEVARLAREAAERREAIFLLDGLDEVEPSRRGEMIARLNAWAAQSGGVWIIGSRFTEYKGGQFTEGRYREWELLPLDRPARLELARRLLPALLRLSHMARLANAEEPGALEERLSPTALVDALEERPQTRAWAENPLLLSLAALVYAREGALPARRAGLYRAVVGAALAGREPEADRRAALRLRLALAALRLFQQRGRTFSRAEALAALATAEPPVSAEEAERALWQVARAGLIDAPSVGPCSFRHLTFQEYLAGEALADGLTSRDGAERTRAWDLAWSKRLYSRWMEPLRLMTGALGLRADGAEVALRWTRALLAQREERDGDPGGLGFALAARCVSELPDMLDSETGAGGALAETQRSVLDVWLMASRRGFAGYRDALTARAWEVAGDIGALPSALIQPVVGAFIAETRASLENAREYDLRHGDGRMERLRMVVALGSVYALARLGEEARLLGRLYGWAATSNHHLAYEGMIPEEVAATLLADPMWRNGIARALDGASSYGLAVSVDLLLRYAEDPDVGTRQAIIRLLGAKGDPTAAPVILAALQAPDPSVREAAAQALGGMGELAPVEPLLAALRDDQPAVRHAAAHALIHTGAPFPEATLWQIIDLLYGPLTRGEAIHALGMLARAGDERARARLIEIAYSYQAPGWGEYDGYDIYAPVADALGSLPKPPLDVIVEIARDEGAPGELRAHMLGALGRVAPGVAAPLLLKLLDDAPNEYTRSKVAGRFMASDYGDMVNAVVETPQYRGRFARIPALSLLAVSPDERMFDVLRVALADRDTDVQRIALAALNMLASNGVAIPDDITQSALDKLRSAEQLVREEALELMITLDAPLPEDIWLAELRIQMPNENLRVLSAHPPVGATMPDDVAIRVLQQSESLNRVPRAALARTMALASRETLRAAVEDERMNVFRRSGMIITQRALGEPVSLQWPIEAARDNRTAFSALGAIQACRDEFSTQALEALVRSPSPQIAHVAIDELLTRDPLIGVRIALERLARTPSTEPWHRYEILSLLCAHDAPEALAPLMAHLQSPDNSTHRFAGMRLLRELLGRRPDLHEAATPTAEAIARAALADEGDESDAFRIEAGFLLRTLGLTPDPAPLYEMLRRYGANAYEGYMGTMNDCGPVLELLATSGEPLSLEFLLDALRHTHPGVRAQAVKLLAERPEAAQPLVIERIAPLLGDIEYDANDIEGDRVMRAAYAALRRLAPAVVEQAVAEARALLLEGVPGRIFGPVADAGFIEALRDFDRISPRLIAWVTSALDSPHWRVRANAAWTLHMHHRSVPDAAIRRLYALRHDPESPYVRSQADQALGAILSLETGMEDE